MSSIGVARRREADKLRAHAARNRIADMVADGLPDKDISVVLGLPLSEVSRQRALLPATIAVTWTAKEDTLILNMRNKDHLWTEIGRKLKRKPDDVRKRHEALMHRILGTKPPKPGKIKCYCCRNEFFSPDVRRNRRCEECRARQEGMTGDYSITGVGHESGGQARSAPPGQESTNSSWSST